MLFYYFKSTFSVSTTGNETNVAFTYFLIGTIAVASEKLWKNVKCDTLSGEATSKRDSRLMLMQSLWRNTYGARLCMPPFKLRRGVCFAERSNRYLKQICFEIENVLTSVHYWFIEFFVQLSDSYITIYVSVSPNASRDRSSKTVMRAVSKLIDVLFGNVFRKNLLNVK